MTERLPQNYIPISYDLFIHIIKKKKKADASVCIHFKKNGDSDEIVLHIKKNITIKEITQNEIPLTYSISYPKLIINCSKDPLIDITKYPILIDYTVTADTENQVGFFYSDNNYLTFFEPDRARYLFPCYDEPFARSIFKVKLQIPSKLVGLSNMPIETVTTSNNEKTITFLPTPPMCTYLLCICVGDFHSISGQTKSGLPIEFYYKEENEEEEEEEDEDEKITKEEQLNVAIYTVEWMEAKFKVKYELPKLQLILLSSIPYGMENYGLITLPTYSGQHLSKNQLLLVVIHEIVHQWFGDLVSIDYWNSIWLNEGFAQFVQYLILRDYMAEFGDEDFDVWEFCASVVGYVSLTFYEKGVLVPSDANIKIAFKRIFNYVLYCKGPFVLKMFYDIMGEEQFIDICSKYLDKYKNKTVAIPDFISVVDSTLNKSYSSFFDPWLHTVGFPVLFVKETEYDEKNKVIKGIEIEMHSKNDVDFQFNVPILYRKNRKSYEKVVSFVNQKVCNVDLDCKWVIVNNNISSLCFVIYSKLLLQRLVYPHKKGMISEITENLIQLSIDANAFTELYDEGMTDLYNDKFRSE